MAVTQILTVISGQIPVEMRGESAEAAPGAEGAAAWSLAWEDANRIDKAKVDVQPEDTRSEVAPLLTRRDAEVAPAAPRADQPLDPRVREWPAAVGGTGRQVQGAHDRWFGSKGHSLVHRHSDDLPGSVPGALRGVSGDAPTAMAAAQAVPAARAHASAEDSGPRRFGIDGTVERVSTSAARVLAGASGVRTDPALLREGRASHDAVAPESLSSVRASGHGAARDSGTSENPPARRAVTGNVPDATAADAGDTDTPAKPKDVSSRQPMPPPERAAPAFRTLEPGEERLSRPVERPKARGQGPQHSVGSRSAQVPSAALVPSADGPVVGFSLPGATPADQIPGPIPSRDAKSDQGPANLPAGSAVVSVAKESPQIVRQPDRAPAGGAWTGRTDAPLPSDAMSDPVRQAAADLPAPPPAPQDRTGVTDGRHATPVRPPETALPAPEWRAAEGPRDGADLPRLGQPADLPPRQTAGAPIAPVAAAPVPTPTMVQGRIDDPSVSAGFSDTPELSALPMVQSVVTPGAIAAVSASPSPDPRAVANQLTEAFVAARPNGTIEIALDPVELGRVRMVLSPESGAMAVALSAERPETLELLRRTIDLLANDLRDLGYGTLSFRFDQSGAGSDRPDSRGKAERAGPAEPEAKRSIATAGLGTIGINGLPTGVLQRLDIRV